MKNILILFAHPRYEKSRANRALLAPLRALEGITVHDLYETYPDFNIDVPREWELLQRHEIVVWHYPFYLYSAPAMLKQWMDVVLEYGWAHGEEGNHLAGKWIFHAITTGGTRESYARGGFNRYTLAELLAPMEQTAHLCKMAWLPPFAVQGTYRLKDPRLADYAQEYREVLRRLAQAPPLEEVRAHSSLNDWVAAGAPGGSP